ncbi:MAG: MarR family winged helix-turn-helix transcriptional regulator [Kiloniellales bacterium]
MVARDGVDGRQRARRGSEPQDLDLDVLEGLLSFYVRSVSYTLSKNLDESLKGHAVAKGSGKITALLLIDRHPGIRPSTIAEITLRDRPSISRIIRPMVDEGLVEQRTSKSERRAEELFITEKGHAEAEAVRAIISEQSDAFFADTPKEDRAHLFRILRGLYRNIRGLP